MRVLIIGGTGFIGPPVARQLVERGHAVAILHRGKSQAQLPEQVEHFLGERKDLARLAPSLRAWKPDVVLDLILATEKQARATMDAFREVARRVVAASSCDVYRAMAILHRMDPGPLEPLPLTEDSALRTTGETYSKESIENLRKVFAWVEPGYDKIPVERAILGDAALPGCVLRLPMVYGPGDPLHRFHPYLKRMDDARPAILLEEKLGNFSAPRGYVENVAHALVLAIEADKSVGRIYNVAETTAFSEFNWVKRIAKAAGWRGKPVLVPEAHVPAHLKQPFNFDQGLWVSCARIRDELGYEEIVSLEESLEKTIEWERANRPKDVPAGAFDYAAEDAALAASKPAAPTKKRARA